MCNLFLFQAGSKSLLLTEMFDKQSDSKNKAQTKPTLQIREVGKTVKRKHLPPLQQVMMDAERKNAIQRYRDMKAKKMKMSS